MIPITARALGYVLIIIIAYFFQRKNIVSQESSQIFSTIMLSLTLPCAIVVNLNHQVIPVTMLFIIGIGILYNLISLLIGYKIGCRNERGLITMLNVSGYNIGCFAMPFVSHFFTPQAILITSLFDIGNSIMCLGFNNGIASALQIKNNHIQISTIFKKVIHSIPIWTYIVMLLLSFFSLQVPDVFLPFFETVANANSFIAMIVIGLSIHITYKKEYLHHILHIISIRLIISIFLALLSYIILTPIELRNVIVILCFSPIGAAAVIFTKQLHLNSEEAACINSLYVIISIIIMSILILL